MDTAAQGTAASHCNQTISQPTVVAWMTWALEMLALTYAAECRDTSVKVNLLNPGPMRTAMRAKAMPGEDPNNLVTPEAMTPKVVEMLSPAYGQSEAVVDFRG